MFDWLQFLTFVDTSLTGRMNNEDSLYVKQMLSSINLFSISRIILTEVTYNSYGRRVCLSQLNKGLKIKH